MQKKCSRCQKIKDVSEFRRNKRTSDGYAIWCKECKKKYPKEYLQEYYHDHREKISNRSKAYYQEHRQDSEYREKKVAQSRKWRREHPEQIKAYQEKNRERDRKRRKKYHEEHREEERERHHRYQLANKDKIRERTRQYRKTPRGYLSKLICDLRYRARLENCEINDFDAKQAKLLLKKSTRCPICGERFLKSDRRALDHIVALSKGGNNTLLNIQVVHLGCNSRKSNRHYANYGDGQLLLIPKFQESPFKKPEPIVVTEKKCIHCQIIKPIEMFPKNEKARDGHLGTCERCMQVYRKEYREERKEYFAEHPEEYLEQLEERRQWQRQWRKERVKEDPDYYKKLYYQDLEGNRARAKKHREKHKEYYRDYQETHQEYYREYYLENAARQQKYSREYYRNNREKSLAYGKQWRKEHPDYYPAYRAKSRKLPKV